MTTRLLYLAVFAAFLAAPQASRQVLAPGKKVSARLEKGQVHQYTLLLKAGQFVRLHMDRVCDLPLGATSPEGKALAEVDGLFAPGSQNLWLQAETDGAYLIHAGKPVETCNYSVEVAEIRPSVPEDAIRLEAQKLTLEGLDHITKPEEAEPLFLKAAELWRKTGDAFGTFDAVIGVAYCSRYTNRPSQHHAYAMESLELARRTGDRHGEAGALYHIGMSLHSLGEAAKAIDELDKSADLYAELGDAATRASSLNVIGGIYDAIGQQQRALQYFGRTIPIFRDLGDERRLAAGLLSISASQLRIDQPAEAEKNLQEALKLYRNLKDPLNESIVLRFLGQAAEDLGHPEQSIAILKQSVALARTLKTGLSLGSSLNSLGFEYGRQEKWEPAAEVLRESVELWRKTRSGVFGPSSISLLARAESELGHLEKAQELASEAVDLVEKFRSRAGGAEARAAYSAQSRNVYPVLVDTFFLREKQQPDMGFREQAFLVSEKSRAKTLMETLAGANKPPEEARREMDGLERQIQTRLRAQAELERKNHSKAEADSLAAEISELRNRKERQAFRSSQPPANLSALDTATLQKDLLDDGTVLLEFLLNARRSYVWAVSRSSVSMVELPANAVIRKLAQEAHGAITARNANPAGESLEQRQKRVADADALWERKAAELSAMLLQPVRSALNKKRWLIVADASLHFIPFNALPPPEGAVAPEEVVTEPSATVLAAIRRNTAGRKQAPKTVAIFADPVFEAADARVTHKGGGIAVAGTRAVSVRDQQAIEVPRLPFTRREASAIAGSLPPGQATVAMDFRASRAALLSTDFSAYRIAHFATHGIINSEAPELSGIALSMVDAAGKPQDGFLRLHDVYNMNMPVELAVLSACQTALGKEMSGEGIIGLTRGMIHAGAARVVSSLWKVDDAATAELMRLFYQGMLNEGRTPSASLRAAQTKLAAQRRWRAAYFWAAFQIQGEYR